MQRTALVTGASSGLGRATAVALADAGFDVALVARTDADLAAVADQVRAAGRTAGPLVADLADTAALPGLVSTAVTELGGIDVLVNAAATDAPGPAHSLSTAAWERVLAVNLTAPFVLARETMPSMAARGGGLVVNISSVAGRRGWAEASAYCSTKFALTGLTQALAAEGSPDGTRVCCLYPGAMATSWGVFDPADRHPADPPPAEDALDPATVAGLIVWLATAPGRPVLADAVIAPLLERGWP